MFTPNCLPVLIGSLPLTDHRRAVETILDLCPEIPLWPQLPKLPGEGMVRQFLSGFPGVVDTEKKFWIDTASDDFPAEMAQFYEDFLSAEDDQYLLDSRFSLNFPTSPGFKAFTDVLKERQHQLSTAKGQVTGPVTTGIGARDQDGRSIFYDENLRDMLVKHLSLKGRWQALQLLPFCHNNPPIVFIDEPAMVSFGSSAFTGVTAEMVTASVNEVIDGIHQGGGLAGIHICANGDWSPALSSSTDIISFDAYSFFENFILYRDQLHTFLNRGGILAWGIVPTGDPESVEKESADSLFNLWQSQLETLSALTIDKKLLKAQTLIAPACGTGSLSLELATKVLQMTNEISKRARAQLVA